MLALDKSYLGYISSAPSDMDVYRFGTSLEGLVASFIFDSRRASRYAWTALYITIPD